MIRATDLIDSVNPQVFLEKLANANTTHMIEELLAQFPIAGDSEYLFDADDPSKSWCEGKFHWFPVGRDRGNAGRIKLAGSPENPIAERTVNSMEGVIELMRQRELLANPTSPCPTSPRDAVKRYFKLPPLDQLPHWPELIEGQKPPKYGREIARQIRVKLIRSDKPRQYTIAIEDDGIGQTPAKMHSTLLSLGHSDKGDKPYLIGVFGQGGSSAYAASTYSYLLSRRAPDLRTDAGDGDLGWTIVRHVFPKGRRDDYFAYLAAHPDGRVPVLPGGAADEINFQHGTSIRHIDYNFGKTEPSASLYSSLNHLLFNPMLPYELMTRPKRGPDVMWGNAYRLSKLGTAKKALDKSFDPQAVQAAK